MTEANNRNTFLEALGLMTGTTAASRRNPESLNWDAIVNNGHAQLTRVDSNLPGDSPEFMSYSGADTAIYLLYDNGDTYQGIRNFVPFREIQTLSVSSARSVHPVRRLGESHVTAYTRGARTIAGSMVCISGEKDPFAKVAARSIKERTSDSPFFTDEIPEFSILILATNEYGQVSHAGMSGVTLTNFGQTFSVEDLYLETTYTYVCRYYHPILPDPNVLNKLPYEKTPLKLSNPFGLGDKSIKDFVFDRQQFNKTMATYGLQHKQVFSTAETAHIEKWVASQATGGTQ